jgi:hypothetical protein
MTGYTTRSHTLDHYEPSQFDNALTRRILAWFTKNPEEFLTYDDMAVKFDCTPKQAAGACNTLQRDHGATRVKDGEMMRMDARGEK